MGDLGRSIARNLARENGLNPDEVVGIGPATRMSGDNLTDGDEVPAWYLFVNYAGRLVKKGA